MNSNLVEIRGSYALDLGSLTCDERALWRSLPAEYREFLMHHNGGFVAPSRSSFRTRGRQDDRSCDGPVNSLEELWGFLSYENARPVGGKPASILHEHYDRHIHEDFLPRGVFAVGRCVQDSLICVSTNRSDHGAIYYWEWYWRYPWHRDFFEERIRKAAAAAFPNISEILEDPDHELHRQAVDALNCATIVRVADSFSEFINTLSEE